MYKLRNTYCKSKHHITNDMIYYRKKNREKKVWLFVKFIQYKNIYKNFILINKDFYFINRKNNLLK